MVANVPSATLKFDTDFDFASSNAQFIKEEVEREMQDMNIKGWLNLFHLALHGFNFPFWFECLNIKQPGVGLGIVITWV